MCVRFAIILGPPCCNSAVCTDLHGGSTTLPLATSTGVLACLLFLPASAIAVVAGTMQSERQSGI